MLSDSSENIATLTDIYVSLQTNPEHHAEAGLPNSHRAHRVLIGPVSDDPAESVSAVNRAFVTGLGHKYRFFYQRSDRRYGATRQGALNVTNCVYFGAQLFRWSFLLLRHCPKIAHYAINSGWALHKSLVFLKCARLARARCVGHLHGGLFLKYWTSLGKYSKSRLAAHLHRLDAFVVTSDAWRRAIVTTLGMPDSRVFVVNNPIDPAFEAAVLEMPCDRRSKFILSLGVMEKAKGVLDILAAAEAIRSRANGCLLLAGPEREPGIQVAVQRFISSHSLQDSVEVRGAVWRKEKVEVFRAASIFLLPSYCENFPLVVLEAAAAGLALVTTPVGAIPEFFEHGVSALFVEPGNVQQIADAIVRLFKHPEERLRLARAAREVFTTRLSRQKIMADMDRVYQTILSRPRV